MFAIKETYPQFKKIRRHMEINASIVLVTTARKKASMLIIRKGALLSRATLIKFSTGLILRFFGLKKRCLLQQACVTASNYCFLLYVIMNMGLLQHVVHLLYS